MEDVLKELQEKIERGETDWVIQVKFKPKVWWDNLEWQNYVTPGEDTVICSNKFYWTEEVICYLDYSHWYVANSLKLEWLYKMVAYQGYKASSGWSMLLSELAARGGF